VLRPLRILLLVAIATAVAGATAQRADPTHLKIIVGVTDDTAKWMVRQEGVVGVHRDLRLMAVRVTVPWRPGQVRPTKLQQIYLHRISRMIQLNDRIVLSVYNWARFAPVGARTRSEYCAFLRGVVRRIPLIHDIQIWNEANSPVFWPSVAGAESYEALLARCWDVLHSLPTLVNVISSTAPRHDPVGFILELGEAYRASGRARPLVDTFGHNPYPEDSAEPPSATHEDSDFVGEGDYQTLMNVLLTAFDGSGQPVPGVGGVTIWYLETGFQTVPPPNKRRFYHGRENDPEPIPAVAPKSDGGQPPLDQATQLREAILLAYCQPAVSGFFNFMLLDEDELGGWQSGVLWRDGTRKPSYVAFKAAIAEVRRRDTDCSKVRGAPPPSGSS
jgi:hypothetical protein